MVQRTQGALYVPFRFIANARVVAYASQLKIGHLHVISYPMQAGALH